jgi:hypothetical protein
MSNFRAPRSTGATAPGPSAVKPFNMADITSEGKPLPGRFGLYGNVGFGKTSLAAYAPSPIFLETKGETGLETLIAAGQLPATPHFPELKTWGELLSAVSFLKAEPHTFRSLVIDTANGAEKLMHEHVCARDFGGDWGDTGFASYQKGYDVALADWRLLLNALDELRISRGMTIFLLFHSRVKTFRNPNGADYDRYSPEMHEKTWALTKGWLDNILFGNFEVLVKTGNKTTEAGKKGKASEVSHRILYTNSDNPTYDAKNRLGLPDEIEMGDGPEEGWNNLATAIKAARKTFVAGAKPTATAMIAEPVAVVDELEAA